MFFVVFDYADLKRMPNVKITTKEHKASGHGFVRLVYSRLKIWYADVLIKINLFFGFTWGMYIVINSL